MYKANTALITAFLDRTKLPETAGFVKMEPPAISVPAESLGQWECRRRKMLTLADGASTDGGSCLMGVLAIQGDLKPTAEISFHRAPGSNEKWESPFVQETINVTNPPQPRLQDVQCPRNEDGAPLYFYPLVSEDFVHAGRFIYTMRVHLEQDEYIADGQMLVDADDRCEPECGPNFCGTPHGERTRILRTMAQLKKEEIVIDSASTKVTVFLDDSTPIPDEGFIRLDSYGVQGRDGKMNWGHGQRKRLTESDGGVAPNGRCVIGVWALKPDLDLSAVVSFYRAPEGRGEGDSPFGSPAIRRVEPLPRPVADPHSGPQNQDGFFYPILSENFIHPGNYFYTVCVRLKGTEKVYICDPEMEIGPYSAGDTGREQ